MQIVTNQQPKPLPRAEEIEQFLSQHNATGFALFCWNDKETNGDNGQPVNPKDTFSAMAANLQIYAACEGIYAEDTGDLARMVILRWCRRDAKIKEERKEKERQGQANNCINLGYVESKEAA